MPATCDWFSRLGFEVWHIPGVSRAWRFDFDDGSYVLVTDLGGYDLPQPGGPFTAMTLSSSNEMINYQDWLHSTRALVYWFRHISRICTVGPIRRSQRHLALQTTDA